MRIICPTCDAAYELPPDRVRPGRSVRCARCSAQWTPVPAVAAMAGALSAAPPLVDTPPPPMPELPPPAPEAILEPPEPVRAEPSQPEPSHPEPSHPEPLPEEPPPAPREPPQLRIVPSEPPPEPVFKPLVAPEHAPQRAAPPVIAAEPGPPLLAAIAAEPPPPPRGRLPALALAWVATLVTVALLLAATYAFRPQIVRAWPPSERAYDAVGLR